MTFRPMYAFAILLAALGASGHAHAEQLAYAWADQPRATSYAPNARFVSNNGQPVRVTRAGTGNYTVHFGRLATTQANVQVSMYGNVTGFCAVQNWETDYSVAVRCFDAAGHSADRQFSVVVFRGESADQHDAAYFWLNDPGVRGQYLVYSASAFPAPIQVRSRRTGVYAARVGSIANGPIAMMVTGAGNTYCAPLARSSGQVMITCRNASGAEVDRASALLVLRRGFADASFVTASLGGRGVGEGWSSDGSTQSVHRDSIGRYTVRIGPQASSGGIVQATAYFSTAFCHAVAWSGGAAIVRCDRDGRPVDSAFTVTAIKAGSPSREVQITQRTWSSLLHVIAGGLRVHINNYDPTNRSPLTCTAGCPCHPDCPAAYHAMKRDDSVISYHSSILGAGSDFSTRFTPKSVWRDPFLFLLNDINLVPNRIQARADHGQVIVDLPFESNGREVATACHKNVICGWGSATGNNKPNAEIDNLVIHVPFRLSLDRAHGAPHIVTTMGHVTYNADVRRAGACHNNALAKFCDLFGGDIEGQINGGIRQALDGFVNNSAQIQNTINRGVNVAVCQLARARGQDCAHLSEIHLESNGDITLVF